MQAMEQEHLPSTGMLLAAETPETPLTERPAPAHPWRLPSFWRLQDHRGGPGTQHNSCGIGSHDPAALWNNYIKLLQSCIPGEGGKF